MVRGSRGDKTDDTERDGMALRWVGVTVGSLGAGVVELSWLGLDGMGWRAWVGCYTLLGWGLECCSQ